MRINLLSKVVTCISTYLSPLYDKFLIEGLVEVGPGEFRSNPLLPTLT